jgi:SAM-dependent methyltransferase
MSFHVVKNIVVVILGIIAASVVVRQCRKPTWWPGRLFLWSMNISHSGMTSWGLKHLPVEKHSTILDVGCGGGRTIHRLAAMATEGKVFGIDYSDESVAVSRRTNREWIAAGRVEIRHGSVSSLPFPDRTFDLITAIETHYYWPDPVADMQEILRVLKPGGRLAVIGEVYKREGSRRTADELAMKLLGGTCVSLSELGNQFSTAGFSDVEMFEESRKGWFCGVARRAES